MHLWEAQSKKHHFHPLKYFPHQSLENSHVNGLQSVEAGDATITQKQTAEKLSNPDVCLGRGLSSQNSCLLLTGETSISYCPEMKDAVLVDLPCWFFFIDLHTLHWWLWQQNKLVLYLYGTFINRWTYIWYLLIQCYSVIRKGDKLWFCELRMLC